MKYVSTRGHASAIDFRQAILSGLAPDGGLYVPEVWPAFAADEVLELGKGAFAEAAARVLAPFAQPFLDNDTVLGLAKTAYASFSHEETAPLVSLGYDAYLLELFHGPTLAFKDVAMQLLAQFYSVALDGAVRPKTIIGATSGDTGGAAIHAFANKENVNLVMLHPKGRISEVQRRIMTTNRAANIHNLAVDGSFDDCQQIVKSLFADDLLNRERDLGGVNSINWVRLAIQMVYYFTTASRLGGAANYVVPTGNFGDIFAGYAAKRTGLPVAKLAVAVNQNDIMHRALATGEYRPSDVTATSSPSMDIQVASNFERLLFDATGRDSVRLKGLMNEFAVNRGMIVPSDMLSVIAQDFISGRASEGDVAAMIKRISDTTDMLIDPHTAVGLVVADALHREGSFDGPVVTLATAHPAKFPDAVKAASGRHPGLPTRYSDLFEREERQVDVAASVDAVRALVIDLTA